MDLDLEPKLTNRDYVTLIFVAIIMNVLLCVAFCFVFDYETVRTCFQQTATKYDNILCSPLVLGVLGVIAIPMLYLEGHLIFAIDNLVFLTIINQKMRLYLYNHYLWKILFCLLYTCRIYGQKCFAIKRLPCAIQAVNAICDPQDDESASSYYMHADFCKGVMWAFFATIIIFLCCKEWILMSISGLCYILLYVRATRYSKLYVDRCKKCIKRETTNNKYLQL